MLIRFANGRTTFLDFRERAPLAATRDMYLDKDGKPTRDSLTGWRAPGVPGTARGLEMAQRKYGKAKWADVVAPSVKLAREGFTISYGLANGLKGAKNMAQFAESKRIFQKNGAYHQAGEKLVQPELAAVLERIQKLGARDFYEGETARIIMAQAAESLKRLTFELGGKSPNIVLDDDAFAQSVAGGVMAMMLNSGQSCNAPSRMLVPRARMDEAVAVARTTAESVKVGDAADPASIGPVASRVQFDKIQRLIQTGVDEGAEIVAGGLGRPEGLDVGYYVRPTVFAGVSNTMTIAREEIFGPVLCILGYDDVEQAVQIGNDTEYGLYGYVTGADLDQARAVARQIRAGTVSINHAIDISAPFGGYKQSGNGREWGEFGFHEFLETKGIVGYTKGAGA